MGKIRPKPLVPFGPLCFSFGFEAIRKRPSSAREVAGSRYPQEPGYSWLYERYPEISSLLLAVFGRCSMVFSKGFLWFVYVFVVCVFLFFFGGGFFYVFSGCQAIPA